MALLERAAGQGHTYAVEALAHIHRERKEHEQAVEWFTKGAEAGLPRAMYQLGYCLDGVRAWRRRTTRRRPIGSGARQMLVTRTQRKASATCTLSRPTPTPGCPQFNLRLTPG
jgi:TPR repeat protein